HAFVFGRTRLLRYPSSIASNETPKTAVYAGIRQRDGKSVAIAIVTFLLYGGMIWGVMPFLTGSSVSWESHLFGGIAGGVAAHYLCGRKTR
ncbi:MAG: hypothetical protein AAF518_22380, partial [Spirochaetota bacterium]